MGFKTPAASEFGGAVEAGVYQAKFTKYYGPKDGRWGQVIDAEFEIVNNDEYEGQKVTWNFIGITSKKMNILVSALNGGEYDEIDLDEFINTRVKITVDEVEKDGSLYSNVINVKPSARQAPPKKARPVVEDDEEFDVDDRL